MGFILKSIFWVGIVCLFLPRDPSAVKAPKALAQISATSVIDMAAAGAGFCQKQPEICESALKTGAASRDILNLAAATLSATMADTQKTKPKAN